MDAGTYAQTNFAVISDHGHLPVRQVLNPNVYLVEAGLIQLDSQGNIASWQAYCNSTSLSCQVVMKDPQDQGVRDRLETVSYTHLDVYKRQTRWWSAFRCCSASTW